MADRPASTATKIRVPQRSRGMARFQHLLDSTEALLVTHPDEDISLSLIAEQAGVPLPSIYHFFPNRNAILAALAERFHAQLAELAGQTLDPPPARWQDIVRRRQIAGAEFLNRHPAALRLFMGAGVSAEVRTLDLRGNASLAARRAAEFRHWFDCRAIPDLQYHIAISVGVMDGVWAISWSEHRCITDSYRETAMRASIAYLRTVLPEDLPANQVTR